MSFVGGTACKIAYTSGHCILGCNIGALPKPKVCDNVRMCGCLHDTTAARFGAIVCSLSPLAVKQTSLGSYLHGLRLLDSTTPERIVVSIIPAQKTAVHASVQPSGELSQRVPVFEWMHTSEAPSCRRHIVDATLLSSC